MTGYAITQIEVTNPEDYKQYLAKVTDIVTKFGGEYLVRGGDIKSDTTSWKPKRVVILEFPTLEDLNNFRDSEEYKPVAAIRLKASTSEGFVVEGI